jgi:error-prone DNA polymerase
MNIDVDFEHERREKVIQWVYNTYGRASRKGAQTAALSNLGPYRGEARA